MTDQTAVPPVDTTAPPPAPQTPAYDGPEWMAGLPEDIRGEKSLSKYTSVESAARGLISAQRLIGMEKVPRPRGDFDPSNPDWAPMLEALGRPASADAYRFEPAKLPDGLTYDQGMEDAFKPAAHAMGLNPKQAQNARDFYVAYMASRVEQATQEREADFSSRRAAMERELGPAFDSWTKAAEAAQSEYVPEGLLKRVAEAGLARDPDWIKFLGRIGKEFMGDEKLKNAGVTSVPSPADWKAKADEFRNTHAAALFDSNHPDHKRATAEYTKMFQAAFPE